jgi:hypothetical protein
MSIVFGPQGYAQPPLQQPIPPAIQAEATIPFQPQPAIEVTQSEAHEDSGTAKDDTDPGENGGRAFDPHGARRGKLLDIRR